MQKKIMKNQSNISNPDILGDFCAVHYTIDLENLEHLIEHKGKKINNFNYKDKDINIDTYYAINYIIQKIENIYSDDINNIDITIQQTIKTIVQQLRKSTNIGEKLLYQKIKIHQLNKKVDNLKKETCTDPLTGLLNRRAICKEFKKIMGLKNRNSINSSILMIDIDHFKIINDTYGHDIGDNVLIELSNIFREKIRKSDVIGRLGGEEFIIIMYGTPIEGALEKANEIRINIQNTLCKRVNIINQEITISIGISQTRREDSTCTDLIKRADNLLLNAKNNGRNCILFEK